MIKNRTLRSPLWAFRTNHLFGRKRNMRKFLAIFAAGIIAVPRAVSAQSSRTLSITPPSPTCVVGLCGGTPISVFLNVPFYATVSASSRMIVVEGQSCFPPGTRFYDGRSFAFEYAELPVAVGLYSDSLCQNLIGYAPTVLRMSRGQPASLTIDPNTVRRLDGLQQSSGGMVSPYAATPVGLSHQVSFPWNTLSEHPAQFVNATNFRVICRTSDNRREIILGPGEIVTRTFYLLYEGVSVLIRVACEIEDSSRRIGYYETSFSIFKDLRGPHADQIVISPLEIRRPH